MKSLNIEFLVRNKKVAKHNYSLKPLMEGPNPKNINSW